MASVCLTQNRNHLQQFQLHNSNNNTASYLILQQKQHEYQQQNQHQKTITKHQPIAPAPITNKKPPTSILGINNSINLPSGIGGVGHMQQKKKYTYANMPYGEQLPSVARRNARERNRVKQVNNGFANLRQHIPQTIINTLTNGGGRGASKKLSKVDTLRIAVEYIRGLQDLLDSSDESDDIYESQYSSSSPVSSTNYSLTSPDYQQNNQIQIPFSSEASASPTPSYSDSDISIGGANYLQPSSIEEHQQIQMQFKFEPYDNYGATNNHPDTPDDEEILDYISSWQED